MSIKNLYQSSSEQTSLKMTIGLQQQHRHIHRKVKVHVYAHNKLTLSFKKKKTVQMIKNLMRLAGLQFTN